MTLGYSPEVTNTFLTSQRQSIMRIYNTTWKAFPRWCIEEGHQLSETLSHHSFGLSPEGFI